VLVVFCVAAFQQVNAETQCAWNTHMSESQESGMNTRRVIDISVTIRSDLPVWEKPDGLGAHRELVERQDQGGVAFVSKLTMVVHTGTHFDAPSHFLQEAFDSGRGIEAIQLSIMNGAYIGVVTCSWL
jgi:kynurenine formamidase